MSKTIQIRDVPEQVHSILNPRAVLEGVSLSDLNKRELQRTVERPNAREWLDQMRKVKPVPVKRSPTEVIRETRNSR